MSVEIAPPETAPLRLDDATLDKIGKGPRLAWLLNAKPKYRRMLREAAEPELAQVRKAFQHHEDGGAAQDVAKNAVVGINSYQIWDKVLTDPDALNTAYDSVALVTLLGCIGGAAYYVVDDFSWTRVALGVAFLVVALVAGYATMALGLFVHDLPFPRAKRWRNAWAVLLFAAGGYGISYLYRWKGFWADAVFVGTVSIVAALFVLAVLSQVTRVAIGAMYRYTWSAFTVEELIESLAATLAYIDESDAAYRAGDRIGDAIWYQVRAAGTLDHIARCVELYLPATMGLNDRPALREAVLPHLLGAAARVRALAHQCLLSQPGAHEPLKAEVAARMIAAAQGHWGAWDSTDLPDSSDVPGWRIRLNLMTGALLKLVPIVLVAAALVLLYRTDPKSALLDPQVIGAVTAAGFGYLTTLIVSGLNPQQSEQGEPARRGRAAYKPRLGRR